MMEQPRMTKYAGERLRPENIYDMFAGNDGSSESSDSESNSEAGSDSDSDDD